MSQTCPQCQSEAADDAGFCSTCGSALRAATTAPPDASAVGAPAAAATAPAGATTRASSMPAYKFDAARWSLADRIAGVATIVLFISLFLPWFTASTNFGGDSVNGLWHGWVYIVLILCVAIVAYLALRAGWDRLPVSQEIPHGLVMMAATLINFVLILIAFLDKPSGGFGYSVGWGIGAVLGLLAAIAAAAPFAVPQLRAKTTG